MQSDITTSSSQEHNAHPVYRPDIDGLRAVAILSVVLFHAFPTILRGGFIGVDIFFVISGFLISSIIFRSLQRADFSFVEFYAHRVKRIFPALIVVLASSYAVGWVVLLPDEYKQLGKHMAAGAGFVQNIILWQENGYFDTASELKPLMHLWSLAIEEQYYLIYPLLMWGAWRVGLNVLTTVMLLGLLSFGLNISGIEKDAVRTFFLPQTRFWELLLGSVLAYLQLFKRGQFAGRLKHWIFHPLLFKQPPLSIRRDALLNHLLSFLGMLLLFVSVLGIDKDKLFPGWWALAPTMGAFLLILAGPGAWVNRNILANRFMVFVGLISYPLYLWHWPILSFARIVESDIPSPEIRMAAVILSAALAWLTFRLLEKPIRFGPKTWVKTTALSFLLAVVGCIGYDAFERDGLGSRLPKIFQELSASKYDYRSGYRVGTCLLRPDQDYKQFHNCEDFAPGKGKTILIWGDSHAAHLYPGFRLRYGADFTIRQRTASSCPPILGMDIQTRPLCREINYFIYDEIKRSKPDKVVLAAIWTDYDWKKLEGTVLELRKIGVSNIDLIGPVPQWKDGLPKQLLSRFRQETGFLQVPYRMKSGLKEVALKLDEPMEIYAKGLMVNYISAMKILCNDSGCLTRLGENGSSLTAWDYGHLTNTASEFLVSRFPEK